MRCFVAIELPAVVRAKLADLQAGWRGLGPDIRWTRAEQIHLTMKFLGEVPDGDVPQICATTLAVAAALVPIELEIRGTGCFPPRGPVRIVWAGVSGPPPELVACHEACERAFAALGFPPEDRSFRPHLTIGRSRDPRGCRGVRQEIEGVSSFAGGRFTATELVVFQSVLGRSGPTYTPLARAPLSSGRRSD